MSKSKHTEAQMIAALKQVEAGRKVDDGSDNGNSIHRKSAKKRPSTKADRSRLTERIGSAREVIDSAEGRAARQEGSEMPIESAILFALEEADPIV